MKKGKLLCTILAVSLSIITVAWASELTSSESTTTAEPTPVMNDSIPKNTGTISKDSLISETSDYDGLEKTATYVINGDEWTVVEKIGTCISDDELPEGFSGYELVYYETITPTPVPISE